MTNGEFLNKALNEIIDECFENRPIRAELATKILDNYEFRLAFLSFVSMLCYKCPNILREINEQQVYWKLGKLK